MAAAVRTYEGRGIAIGSARSRAARVMTPILRILSCTSPTRPGRRPSTSRPAAEPVLDVPGMTEFSLGGATLGLMPAADMEELLAGQVRGGTGQRCELYLRRADAAAALDRAAAAGK